MNYGYFDSKAREYVITRPDTPSPWANYLGSPEYGAIISNNAGGYSFVKSGANGRILRYHFNENDTPGRYIYIRDNKNNDYWSTSWQPCAKNIQEAKYVCRHGTAYTVMTADYSSILAEVTYFVPLNSTHEVWNIKVTNNDKVARDLSTFGFCEFTTHCNYEQDLVNLQYSQFINQTRFYDNMVVDFTNINFDDPETAVQQTFFALAGAKVTGYDGDLDTFIGNYRSYKDPIAVERGKCSSSANYNRNPCGALKTDFVLEPGETKEFSFVLGQYKMSKSEKLVKRYEDKNTVEEELSEIKKFWHSKLENFKVTTPDKNFNEMINTWNAYQCFITFIWSRAASFTYCGLRNGYGYRDTVQDIQGIIHLDPKAAEDRIRFMISAQALNGGGLPLVKYTHNAGHEDTPDEQSYVTATGHPSYRSDDALWLFPTVEKYICESGNVNFLDEVIPFANGGEGTVYEHLKRAINFSLERSGIHGLPAGLYADWNDCLRMGEKGESTFVAFQLYLAMNILKTFAEFKKDSQYVEFLNSSSAKLKNTIESVCWDSDRYIRGIRDNGEIVGAAEDNQANLWLNPQSFAILSGLCDKEKAKTIMDNVEVNLNTDYGAVLMNPSYTTPVFRGARAILFNPGTKENAGIFSQAQGWLILAETMLGEGNRAFKYYNEVNPASMNEKAEIRVMEPYVHCQFTEGKESPNCGRANVHWLTGTATTMMVAGVEGILGMKPQIDGIVIDPCIPSKWDGFTAEKVFRGKKLNIKAVNKNHSEKGIACVTVNGKKIDGILIKEDILSAENDIIVDMK